MMIRVFKDKAELGIDAAEFFIREANDAINYRGKFSVALSGGTTPNYMYEYLIKPEMTDRIRWEKVYIFWGDERCVSLDSSDNNAHNAFELFLNKVPIVPSHIHRIQSDKAPREAARNYESVLRKHFGNQTPEFDMLFLGLGENGHTASLFPETSILQDKEHLAAAVYVEELRMYRVSLTTEIINQARNIVFLVAGHNKASTVQNVIEGVYNPEQLPAQLIKPVHGELYWYLDKDAASLLKEKSRETAAL